MHGDFRKVSSPNDKNLKVSPAAAAYYTVTLLSSHWPTLISIRPIFPCFSSAEHERNDWTRKKITESVGIPENQRNFSLKGETRGGRTLCWSRRGSGRLGTPCKSSRELARGIFSFCQVISNAVCLQNPWMYARLAGNIDEYVNWNSTRIRLPYRRNVNKGSTDHWLSLHTDGKPCIRIFFFFLSFLPSLYLSL